MATARHILTKTVLACILLGLPLAAADEFSDGTANYMVPDWDKDDVETKKADNSINLDNQFKFEVFIINGPDNKCLYNILKIYFSTYTITERKNGFKLLTNAKVSCGVDIYSLGRVVRSENGNRITLRLQNNKCRELIYGRHAKTEEIQEISRREEDCKGSFEEPINEVLELDHGWDKSFSHHDETSVSWDNRFFFTVLTQTDESGGCVSRGLRVSHAPPSQSDQGTSYTLVKQATMTCAVDKHTLGSVLHMISADTLVYRIKGGRCYKATYSKTEEVAQEWDCPELPNKPEDVPAISKENKSIANPHLEKDDNSPDLDGTTILLTGTTTEGGRAAGEDEYQ